MPFLDSPDKGGRKPSVKAKADSDKKLLKRIHDDLNDARRNLSEFRKEGQQADDFFNNHQWEDDDVRVLMEQQKPQITFNRIKPIIQAICGTEIQHRQKIVFLPRHPPQEDVAAASDLATDAVDWAIARTRGEYERSLAFQDSVIRGVGCIGFSLDFEDDPDGKLVMDRIPLDEMLWDTEARKQNLEDVKWVARRRWMSIEEIREMFPDAKLSPQIDEDMPGMAPEDDDLPTTIENKHPDVYREGAQKVSPGFPEPGKKGYLMVTEYEYFDKETYFRILEKGEGEAGPEDASLAGDLPPPDSGNPPPPQGEQPGFAPSAPGMPSQAGPVNPAQMPPPPPMAAGGPQNPAAPPMVGGMVGGQGAGGAPPVPPPPGMGAPPMPPGGLMPPPPGAQPPMPQQPPPAEEEQAPQPAPEKWVSLSQEEFTRLVDRLAAMNQPAPPALKLRRKKFKRAYITGGVVLGKEDLWVNDFTYKFMTCMWDSKKNYWYGLVRSMIDPQKGANKWFSQGVHHFNSGAKGALLVETGAVVSPNKLGNDWARPAPIIQLRDGALTDGRIKVEQPAPFPEAAATMIQYAISALRDATGVNLDMLGGEEGADAAVTAGQRQRQGFTILAGVYSALTRYREVEALTILKILKEHLSDGRWIRIGGPYNSQYRQLLKEDFSEDYDMVIDDEPRDPNMKRETWDQIQPLLPILMRENKLPEGLIDYAPLPASVIASIKKQMREADSAPPPPVKKEENPDWVQSEIDKNKAEIEFIYARAKSLLGQTGMEIAQGAQELREARGSAGSEQQQAEQEREHERQMNQIKLEGKQAETSAKIQQKQAESQSKMAQEREKAKMNMENLHQQNQMKLATQLKTLNEPTVPGGAAQPGGRVM